MASNDRRIFQAGLIVEIREGWVQDMELARNRARWVEKEDLGFRQHELDRANGFLAEAQAELASLEQG